MRDDAEAAGGGVRQRGAVRPRRRLHRDVAAVLAVLVPGLGHVYAGRLRAGVLWFGVVALGYWLVLLPGVVLHVISIWSADCIAAASAAKVDDA